MKLPRRQFLHLAAGVATLPVSRVAWAQAYPARQITMIVPFPPGGSTDVTARVVAERMRPLLAQPVIIDHLHRGQKAQQCRGFWARYPG